MSARRAPEAFRELLRRSTGGSGIPTGLFAKLPSSEICEMVADAGLDFVVIDMEHTMLSHRDVYGMIVTYSNLGVRPLVRVPDHGYGDAQRCLDAGAGGVLYPHVPDADTARRLMGQLSFPPDGTRGQGAASRAGRWGRLAGGTPAYLESGRSAVLRMAMIEDRAGVENIEAVLATDGLDGIFVGPGDLSLSLGARAGDPEVAAAVDRVVAAAVRASVAVGTVVSSPEQARRRVDQGCDFLLFGNDTGIVARAVAQVGQTARQAVEPGQGG